MQLRRFAEISAATSYIHTSEVGAINGCASLQEDSGRVDGAKGRAGVERRASREVTSVDARARVEEQEHEVQPVGDTCPVQRCPAEGGVSHVDHVEGALFVGGSRENGRRENMPGTVYKRYGERAGCFVFETVNFLSLSRACGPQAQEPRHNRCGGFIRENETRRQQVLIPDYGPAMCFVGGTT